MKADNIGRAVATAAVTLGALVLTVLMLDIRTAGAQGSTSIRAACDPDNPAVVILANTRQGTDPQAPGYWPAPLHVWATPAPLPEPATSEPITLGPGQQTRIPWPRLEGLFTISWATGIAPNGVWWPADSLTTFRPTTCGDPGLVDQTTTTTAPTTTAPTTTTPVATTSSTAPTTTVAPTTSVGTAGQPQSPFPPTAAAEPAVPTPSTLPATGPARTPRQVAASALLIGIGLSLVLSIPITRKARP